MLLDEATSALDFISTLKIEELISELKNDFKIIMVTHSLEQAKRVSQETLFMVDGECIEHRNTEKLFANPKDERTQVYIGGGLPIPDKKEKS